MKKLYWKIRAYFFWNFIVPMQWSYYNFFKVKPISSKVNPDFSIGIVTYIARVESFFKPLIKQLTNILPDVEIVIMINGYYDLEAQKTYIDEVSTFLNNYSNVKYTIHYQPEGLSKLWNKLIINSTSSNVFIFNDDIKISPFLRKELLAMKKETISLINNSWSHFLITKKIIQEVGWFDERFLALGNEDQDYEFRLATKQNKPKIVYINKIKNIVEQPIDYSYGKEMKTVNNKYASVNFDFLQQKWNTSIINEPTYLYSDKFQIWFDPKPNLETPNFYPEYVFKTKK